MRKKERERAHQNQDGKESEEMSAMQEYPRERGGTTSTGEEKI